MPFSGSKGKDTPGHSLTEDLILHVGRLERVQSSHLISVDAEHARCAVCQGGNGVRTWMFGRSVADSIAIVQQEGASKPSRGEEVLPRHPRSGQESRFDISANREKREEKAERPSDPEKGFGIGRKGCFGNSDLSL